MRPPVSVRQADRHDQVPVVILVFAIGIATAALTLLAAGLVWARGVPGGFAQLEEVPWIPALGAAYRLGVP